LLEAMRNSSNAGCRFSTRQLSRWRGGPFNWISRRIESFPKKAFARIRVGYLKRLFPCHQIGEVAFPIGFATDKTFRARFKSGQKPSSFAGFGNQDCTHGVSAPFPSQESAAECAPRNPVLVRALQRLCILLPGAPAAKVFFRIEQRNRVIIATNANTARTAENGTQQARKSGKRDRVGVGSFSISSEDNLRMHFTARARDEARRFGSVVRKACRRVRKKDAFSSKACRISAIVSAHLRDADACARPIGEAMFSARITSHAAATPPHAQRGTRNKSKNARTRDRRW